MTYPGPSTYPGPFTFPGSVTPGAPTVSISSSSDSSTGYALGVRISLSVASSTDCFTLYAISPLIARIIFSSSDSSTRYTLAVGILTGPNVGVVPDPTNLPPRMLLTANNISGGTATVYRYGQDGIPTPVRLGNPASLTSGGWTGYDYEMPYNEAVYYVIVPANGTPRVQSGTATVTSAKPWLVHPGVPDLSVPVTVKLLGDKTRRSTAGRFDVLGRTHPVIVTDGQRKGPEISAVMFKTETSDQIDDLNSITQDLVPLLLQVVYPYTATTEYMWLSLGDLTEARKTANFGDTSRVWSASAVEVDLPVGSLQSQRTCNDVLAEALTCDAVLALYVTCRGLLTGIQST